MQRHDPGPKGDPIRMTGRSNPITSSPTGTAIHRAAPAPLCNPDKACSCRGLDSRSRLGEGTSSFSSVCVCVCGGEGGDDTLTCLCFDVHLSLSLSVF